MVYGNLQHAFVSQLRQLVQKEHTVEVKGAITRELLMKPFQVVNPNERIMLVEGRNGNPFSQVAETLWVLAGRDDLDWLERYIPSCKKWSDDGKVWRAAYGPRLRKWCANMYWPEDALAGGTDQIANVYELLKADPETRQAVISLWDPCNDWVISKDIPCNNWLHFIIRDGYLNLNVSVRSNDLWFGFSHIDFYLWSVLQQLLASWLDVEVGYMGWNATSMHIYERHFDAAAAVLENTTNNNHKIMYPNITVTPIACNFYDFDATVNHILAKEVTQYRTGNYASHDIYSGLLGDMDTMLAIYNCYLNEVKPLTSDNKLIEHVDAVRTLGNAVSNMNMCDLKLAAIEYFVRKIPGFIGTLETLPAEDIVIFNKSWDVAVTGMEM